jgi:hypothetical protein
MIDVPSALMAASPFVESDVIDMVTGRS